MRTTIGRLKVLIGQGLDEAMVAASPAYMKKERARQSLQDALTRLVREGDVKTQEDVDAFFDALPMATQALRQVPLQVWQGLAKKPA